jgi:hypothetical protein
LKGWKGWKGLRGREIWLNESVKSKYKPQQDPAGDLKGDARIPTGIANELERSDWPKLSKIEPFTVSSRLTLTT